MNTNITPQMIASYRENGYVLVEDFLSPAEVETWRDAVGEAVGFRGTARIPNRPDADAAAEDSADYYSKVFVQVVNLWQTHQKMKDLILDPRIGKMACELEGIDGIRVWHDQALIKAPWANATSWHLDNPYWSFSSQHSISVWIALDDATYQNGCLYFIPGSHKTATFENVGIGPNMNALFKVYPEWGKQQSVAVPMKAGSCSFHNGLTAHGAGANMTNGWRRAMTCAFMPEGSTFNGKQNILTKEQMAKLKIGDPLNDDVQNPVIWRK